MASGDPNKDLASKFSKLEKFEGQDFRRWKKKMHFFLATLKIVYVLTTPMPEEVDNETLDQQRRRLKWINDDYMCRGHILSGLSNALFDVHAKDDGTARNLWDELEEKYMAADASSKKFVVSHFNSYKMVENRHVMDQYNELLYILGQFEQHNMHMDESIAVSSIIDKLPPSWKEFKHNLKHQTEELTLVQLGSRLRIEDSLRVQESGKGKGKIEEGQGSVNLVEKDGKFKKGNQFNKKKRKATGDNQNSNKKPNEGCWRCGKMGHKKRDCRVKLPVGNKGASGAGPSGSKDPPPQQG